MSQTPRHRSLRAKLDEANGRLGRQQACLVELQSVERKLTQEVGRLSAFNADVQLDNHNLKIQLGILLSALGDSQMRTFILRRKTRGCKCEYGASIQEFSETELKDQKSLHER